MPEVRELLNHGIDYVTCIYMEYLLPIERIGCLQPDRISQDMQQHLHRTTFCVSFSAVSIGTKLILSSKLPRNMIQMLYRSV